MHPIRALLLLLLCLLLIGVAVGRGPVQHFIDSNQLCQIPLSQRVVGTDAYDPAEFAVQALQGIMQDDAASQSYICWVKFLPIMKAPAQLPARFRILAYLYNYLPTSGLRASVRAQFLQKLVAERAPLLAQVKEGRFVASDGASEQVVFDLADQRTLTVHLLAENGLRYVAALEFVEPATRFDAGQEGGAVSAN